MSTITYNGDNVRPISFSTFKHTDNQFQLWHHQPFVEMQIGIEILFPYEDVLVKDVQPPFLSLSEQFYMLELDVNISTSGMLLMIPHNKFYTDETWTTPLPVACSWEGWYPMPLTVIFKHLPNGSLFKSGEPFVQIIAIDNSCHLVKMGKDEQKARTKSREYVRHNREKYITRKWLMASGTMQDNLYNVLSNINKEGKLPLEIKSNKKKFNMIGVK